MTSPSCMNRRRCHASAVTNHGASSARGLQDLLVGRDQRLWAFGEHHKGRGQELREGHRGVETGPEGKPTVGQGQVPGGELAQELVGVRRWLLDEEFQFVLVVGPKQRVSIDLSD